MNDTSDFSAEPGYSLLFEARLNGWLNDGKLLLWLVTSDLERLDGWGGIGQTVNDTSDFSAGPVYALLFEARLNRWLNRWLDGRLNRRSNGGARTGAVELSNWFLRPFWSSFATKNPFLLRRPGTKMRTALAKAFLSVSVVFDFTNL